MLTSPSDTTAAASDTTPVWMSVTEAAGRARVSERTVNRWIAAGTVVSSVSDSGRRLVRLDTVPVSDTPSPLSDENGSAVRQELGASDMSDRAAEASDMVSDTAIAARLEGAPLAAKLHSLRAKEARQRAEEALAEVEFLRAQLQARTDAERELRLLLASTPQALQAVAEQKALPPAIFAESAEKRKVRWWWPWRR